MAVGDAYVLRVVEVDTVAITDLQVVQQVNALDDGLVTPHEMYGPVGTFLDGDIADGQVTHICQCQHMGTGVERLISQGLQFIGILQFSPHEGDAIAMDGALACYGDVLCTVSPKPKHTLATILTKGTQLIDTLIGVGFQRGCSLQEEFDIAFQLDGTSQESMVTGQQHSATALGRTAVDRLLDGLGIVGSAIANSAKSGYVVDLLSNRR